MSESYGAAYQWFVNGLSWFKGVTYLIKQAQLARFGLLICWVQEDATIQQGAVHICHHATHIPQALRLLVCWVLALMHISA